MLDESLFCFVESPEIKYLPYSHQPNRQRALSSYFKVQDFKIKCYQPVTKNLDGSKTILRQNYSSVNQSTLRPNPQTYQNQLIPQFRGGQVQQKFAQEKDNIYLRGSPQIRKLPRIQTQDLIYSAFKLKQSISSENLKDFVMETKTFALQGRIKYTDRKEIVRRGYQSTERLNENVAKSSVQALKSLKQSPDYTAALFGEKIITPKFTTPIKKIKKIKSTLSEEILLDTDKEYKPKLDQKLLYKFLLQRNLSIQQSINQWKKSK